jgi:hypothetical protein
MPTPLNQPSQHTAATTADADVASGLKNQALSGEPGGTRFSLRSLLISTTVLAAVIAYAAGLYRHADSLNKKQLLIYWGATALSFIFCSSWKINRSYKLGARREVRHLVYRSTKWQLGRGRFLQLTGWTLLAAWVALGSYVLATTQTTESKSDGVISISFWTGLAAAALALSLIRSPIFLCEEGIPTGKRTLTPWKYIRQAEWLTGRVNTMKLYRMGGDVYIDVPSAQRDAVEDFIRTKTRFLDAAPRPNPQPAP